MNILQYFFYVMSIKGGKSEIENMIHHRKTMGSKNSGMVQLI